MSPKGYDAVHRGTKSEYSDKGGFSVKESRGQPKSGALKQAIEK